MASLQLSLTTNRGISSLAEPLAHWREANASAAALPLLALLAEGHGRCQLDAAATLGLQIDMESIA